MPMETYRLEVSENAEADELLGDRERVATERIADADWGLTPADA